MTYSKNPFSSFFYNRIDPAFGGPVNLSANGTQPGLRFAKDEDVLPAVFRVQRNLLP